MYEMEVLHAQHSISDMDNPVSEINITVFEIGHVLYEIHGTVKNLYT